MNWIDGHLDLAYLHFNVRDIRKKRDDPAKACISLPDLRDSDVNLIFGTIFTEPDPENPEDPCGYKADDPEAANRAGMTQIELYERLESEGELRIVHAQADLADEDALRPRLVILMEGADPIRDPNDVIEWYARGVRLVGLTWWRGTRYAGGNGRHGPLTAEGIQMARALDTAGIVHDASHLADEAFDMLLDETRGPLVATHSNCRALMGGEDQRHLRDEHIKAIGERDGIVGLNLCSKFLVPEGRATIADCIRHIEHVCAIMGHRHGVALGSDADGGFAPTQLPEGLDHPRKYSALADALRDVGWSDEDVAGFAHGNWRRLLAEILPAE